MSVYVDSAKIAYGRMKMCHMLADTSQELAEMANKIGVKQKWIQYAGTPKEHFDICASKREKAVLLGAIEIDNKRLAELLKAKRETKP